MSTDDIRSILREAASVGYAVTITAAGTIRMAPANSSTETDADRAKKESNAARAKEYRRRKSSRVTERDASHSEPENVTLRHAASQNVTLQPSPPLPPSPLSPTPPIPAPTHAPTPEDTRRERTRDAAADFAAACAITLDLTATAALRTAWTEWQIYRQRLHRLTGTRRRDWTTQAAQQSANLIARAVEQHGERIVLDRIATAIAGGWQGLNFDKLTNGTSHQHNQPRFPAVSAPAKRPAQGQRREGVSEFEV